jgi:myo-inositol 2-dehydrogenase/D-chiro-inositol 1-dehydrogenase
VGHHWRYLSALEHAQELLVDRDVRLAIGHWFDKVPPVPWWVHRDRSGGQVIEQTVHVLDTARVLVGEVVQVQAVACGTPPPRATATAGVSSMRRPRPHCFSPAAFAGGAVGTLAATCLLGWKDQAGLQVYADGLALELTETEVAYETGAGPTVIADPGEAKRRVDRAFLDAVHGRGDDIRASYTEALRTHILACAVARAAASGGPVRVECAGSEVGPP